MTVLLKAKILKTVLRHKRLPNSAQAPSLKNKGVNMRYFLTLLCAAFFMVPILGMAPKKILAMQSSGQKTKLTKVLPTLKTKQNNFCF